MRYSLLRSSGMTLRCYSSYWSVFSFHVRFHTIVSLMLILLSCTIAEAGPFGRFGRARSTCANGQCQMMPMNAPTIRVAGVESNGDVLACVNAARAQHGLAPFAQCQIIDAAAQSHADWMVRTGAFVHSSHPYRENIALGHQGAQEVVDAWMRSPGHRATILSNCSKCGVGVSGVRWVLCAE